MVFYLSAENPLQNGDFKKVEEGKEGEFEDSFEQ